MSQHSGNRFIYDMCVTILLRVCTIVKCTVASNFASVWTNVHLFIFTAEFKFLLTLPLVYIAIRIVTYCIIETTICDKASKFAAVRSLNKSFSMKFCIESSASNLYGPEMELFRIKLINGRIISSKFNEALQ